MAINKKNKDILFAQNGIKDLSRELAKPYTQISIIYPNKSSLKEKNRWVSSVTLWDKNHVGLRITPNMNDVAERIEVGSLSFKRVDEADERDEFFELSEGYSNGTLLQKIILTESGKRIEAGMIVTAPNEAHILIVPNVMPYTLAIRCEEIAPRFFEPEYPLNEYVVESWEEKIGPNYL